MALVDIIGELKLTTWDANCCVEFGEVWVMSMDGSVISDVSLELSTWSLTLVTLFPPEDDVTDVADDGADLAEGVVTAGEGGGGIILGADGAAGGKAGASLLGCTTGFTSVVTAVDVVVVDCCCCCCVVAA